ncbi:hypothetical protein KC325_g49 [Hortaea werneckii]|nr:hypothetical protein KC325_g49 [Hortaea werneckii]
MSAISYKNNRPSCNLTPSPHELLSSGVGHRLSTKIRPNSAQDLGGFCLKVDLALIRRDLASAAVTSSFRSRTGMAVRAALTLVTSLVEIQIMLKS